MELLSFFLAAVRRHSKCLGQEILRLGRALAQDPHSGLRGKGQAKKLHHSVEVGYSFTSDENRDT